MSLYFSLNKHNNILMTTVSFLVERKSRQIVALVVATSLLLRLSWENLQHVEREGGGGGVHWVETLKKES